MFLLLLNYHFKHHLIFQMPYMYLLKNLINLNHLVFHSNFLILVMVDKFMFLFLFLHSLHLMLFFLGILYKVHFYNLMA